MKAHRKPGRWLLSLDDTEMQILYQAMENSRPYEDIPELCMTSVNMRKHLGDAVVQMFREERKRKEGNGRAGADG